MLDKFPSGVVGQRYESVVVKIAILSLFPGLGRNQWSWFWVFWAEWFEHGDVDISCMDVDVVTAWPFPRSEGKSSFAADHWVQNVCAATFWVLDPDIWTNVGRFLLAQGCVPSYDQWPVFFLWTFHPEKFKGLMKFNAFQGHICTTEDVNAVTRLQLWAPVWFKHSSDPVRWSWRYIGDKNFTVQAWYLVSVAFIIIYNI